jgi:nitric oxide reductase subunit B
MANPNLSGGQKLAVHYFTVAMVLFMAQLLFGLLAGLQFIFPSFLYEILDFNVNRMVHINAMVIWMLYGFLGSVYWFLEDESGVPIVGLKWGQLAFWVLTGAVTIVVLV